MSFETLIWVRATPAGSPINRTVLRVLADHAGQDHSCYLKTRLIAAETELSESTVRKALASLIENGLVRIYERYTPSGARRTNRYQLLAEGPDTPAPEADDWADIRQRCEDTPSPTRRGTLSHTEGDPLPHGGGTLSHTEGFPIKEATSSEAPTSKGAAPTRATRIPEDFSPTDELRSWFKAGRYGEVIDGLTEHEKFMDYWRAQPGLKGRKQDWPATWRNWMRTAADRAERWRPGSPLAPTSGPGAGAGASYRLSTTDQKVAQTLELGRRLQAEEDAT